VEGDGLGLDFALFDVDFVAAEDDGDVFAHADEVTWEMVSWLFGRSERKKCLRCQLGTFL
jgi:hypothetical protein